MFYFTIFMEERLAEILIRNSLKVTPSDVVVVDYQNHNGRLFDAVERKIEETGARVEAFERQLITTLNDLNRLDKMLNRATAYLKLGGGEYKNLSEEEAIAIQRKEGDIMNKRCELKWTLTPYPSPYMARELEIPLEELRNLYFDCCFVDYNEQRKSQKVIASQFELGEVSIKDQNTNLKLKIVGGPHYCYGKINIPDGEVFWGIDPCSTEGKVNFNIPLIYGSTRFTKISLIFRSGKVVDYDSNQRDKLRGLLETDPEASYLGEFGIGTNHRARVIGHSFIDEKVKGTFHLALGAMSRKLESRLHIDMVKSLRDCEIRNNGMRIYLS